MKRELKITLSAVAATVAGIASVALVYEKNKKKYSRGKYDSQYKFKKKAA